MKGETMSGVVMRRREWGSLMVEMPFAFWMLIIVLTLPLLDLGTICLRYGFVVQAANDAAHAAAVADSFSADTGPQQLSAVHLAQNQAALTAGSFSHVTLDTVTTNIVITNLNNGAVTRSNKPLAQPANTSVNLYQIEALLDARVDPLVYFNVSFLPFVPGITAPVPVHVAARRFCECPQGLTL